jgi:hypothetical protein
MTSDGSRYGAANNRLSRALRDGDLERAISASKELPRITLDTAVRLLFLMAQARDRRYGRAAARWLTRYISETRDLTPGLISDAADALADMETGDLDAAERLLMAVRDVRQPSR